MTQNLLMNGVGGMESNMPPAHMVDEVVAAELAAIYLPASRQDTLPEAAGKVLEALAPHYPDKPDVVYTIAAHFVEMETVRRQAQAAPRVETTK